MNDRDPSEPQSLPPDAPEGACEPQDDFLSEPAPFTAPAPEIIVPPEPDEPMPDHHDAHAHLPPPPVEEKITFLELGLSHDVLRAIADVGYEHPTPIQAEAIPVVLMGRDVLGTAQTGTGKTASFTLPMIEILGSGRAKARMPRSLILEPTRELAAQVAENFDLYGKYHKLSKALLIGGESMDEQVRHLDRGVDVLIATPGRLLDLFERGRILLNDVKILVIDEADRMLDMGFIPDVEKIVSKLPTMRQTLFFSATMPPEIQRLVDTFLFSPKRISVAPPAAPAANVQQTLILVDELDKREALRRLLAAEDVKNAFIFCNRKKTVNILYRSLKRHGLDAAELHGDMSQPERMRTLDSFKKDEVRLLVCSDVAARGIDIQGVSHVFNFDIPFHAEDYVHRIGRTGRAGLSGHAYSLCTPDDAKSLAAIEQMLGQEIPRQTIEGIAAPDMSSGGEGRGRGGRGGRDRGGRGRADKGDRPERAGRDRSRGRDRDRPERVHEEIAEVVDVAETPVVAVAAVDPAHADQPEVRFEQEARPQQHRDRGDRDRGRDRDRGDRGRDRDRDRGRGRSRGRDDDGDDSPVIGFGADIPAFMQREVKLPPLRKPGEIDETEIEEDEILDEDEAPETRPATAYIEEIDIPDEDEVEVLDEPAPESVEDEPEDEAEHLDAAPEADEDDETDEADEEPAQASEPESTKEPSQEG